MVNKDLRWWLPLLILVVVSSTAVYQWRLHHPSKHKLAGDYVDTIATDIELRRYNEQGLLIQDFKSPYAEHYSQRRITHFKQPTVLVYPTEAGRATWRLTAGSGELSSDKDRVDLSDGVDMHEVVDGPSGKQLLTSKLTWHIDRKVAETDQAVTGTEPGVKVTAVGASFDQNLGVIQLFKDVHADYQPQK